MVLQYSSPGESIGQVLDLLDDTYGNFDPDIQGPGIVASFLVTAYLAIFILLVQYLLDFDPTLNPFRQPGKPARLPRPNPVDMLIHQCKLWLCARVLRLGRSNTAVAMQHPARGTLDESEDGDRFSEVIVNIGDIQTITGLALLIGGYYDLHNNQLSIKNWRFIGRLAWFSTVTHLAVSSCLMRFLYRHTYIRFLRIFFMVLLVVMLLFATIPLTNTQISETSDAGCLYSLTGYHCSMTHIRSEERGTEDGNFDPEPIFAGVFIFMSLLLRLYKLFEGPSAFLSRFFYSHMSAFPRWLIHRIARLQTKSKTRNVLLHMLVLQPVAVCFILARMYIHVFVSKFFEILTVVAVIAYGTFSMFSIWDISSDYRFTFGQVVPVVMLFAPFFILWDHFVGRWPSGKSGKTPPGNNSSVGILPTYTQAPSFDTIIAKTGPDRAKTILRASRFAHQSRIAS